MTAFQLNDLVKMKPLPYCEPRYKLIKPDGGNPMGWQACEKLIKASRQWPAKLNFHQISATEKHHEEQMQLERSEILRQLAPFKKHQSRKDCSLKNEISHQIKIQKTA